MLEADDLFDGFTRRLVATSAGDLLALVGGSGPPVLLVHGFPETHLMWRRVAAVLAGHRTVVAVDLPGYGGSYRPDATDTHVPHSKRAMARSLVEAMGMLGFDRFAVVGHDRGARVSYRMALDHPERVERAALLDIVPTAEVWARADAQFALGYWHWGFLAQPAPLPEDLITAAPDAFFDYGVLRAFGISESFGFDPSALAAYRELFRDPSCVRSMCEDYRAGATVDRSDDEADRAAGRRIECPTLVLWGRRGVLPRLYGDVLEVWRPWAVDVAGAEVDAGHFLAEERPAEVAVALVAFLT